MGLIKAAMGAAGGVMADQWKEFFYCDSMDKDVMVKKGQKRVSGRSSNTKGSDNIITNGSGIAVADGQCMIIVEQGKIVEVCAEPGQFTFDSSTEPSIFTGSLGSSIEATFATIGKRFTYGGDTGKDQRVYYFNTKELIDNKFGTPNPIPFRVVDSKIGLDVDVAVRCSGVYSYRIADPLLFYSNVCGNVEDEYRREELESQLKTEFISALQPAFGKLSDPVYIPISLLFGFLISLLIGRSKSAKLKSVRKKESAADYQVAGSMRLYQNSDVLVASNVTSRVVSSSSGSSSGGSSTHTSSSGRSHGGTSGKF